MYNELLQYTLEKAKVTVRIENRQLASQASPRYEVTGSVQIWDNVVLRLALAS
jgi:hypothetical protein